LTYSHAPSGNERLVGVAQAVHDPRARGIDQHESVGDIAASRRTHAADPDAPAASSVT
jgi:hypothetical protein